MILRLRHPGQPPRDVDMGPGWAAVSHANGAVPIGHMLAPPARWGTPDKAAPVPGERRCRRGLHRLGGVNTGRRPGECLLCRRDRDRAERVTLSDQRKAAGGTCPRGHDRATWTGSAGRCLLCRRLAAAVQRAEGPMARDARRVA